MISHCVPGPVFIWKKQTTHISPRIERAGRFQTELLPVTTVLLRARLGVGWSTSLAQSRKLLQPACSFCDYTGNVPFKRKAIKEPSKGVLRAPPCVFGPQTPVGRPLPQGAGVESQGKASVLCTLHPPSGSTAEGLRGWGRGAPPSGAGGAVDQPLCSLPPARP